MKKLTLIFVIAISIGSASCSRNNDRANDIGVQGTEVEESTNASATTNPGRTDVIDSLTGDSTEIDE